MTDPRYMRPGYNFAIGKLVEELGELQAALGKLIRWGPESVNPELPPDQQETNADWVWREIEDVRQAIQNYADEAINRHLVSKEQAIKLAEMEGDAEIGAGMPDHPLRQPEQKAQGDGA